MTNGWWRSVAGGLAGALLISLAVLAWLLAGGILRMLSAIALLVFVARIIAVICGDDRGSVVRSGAILLVLLLSPVEVSALVRPGVPRLARYASGYPGPVARARARRDEVILGGCLVTGLEPRWVLVW
jgi:hypothetical protein